jgi:hypothetical protein
LIVPSAETVGEVLLSYRGREAGDFFCGSLLTLHCGAQEKMLPPACRQLSTQVAFPCARTGEGIVVRMATSVTTGRSERIFWP